jgi:hypothetical protein
MDHRIAFNSSSSLSLLHMGTTTLGLHYIVFLLLVIVPSLSCACASGASCL